MLNLPKANFWQNLLRSFNICDLLDSSEHSVDFVYSRAGYIYARVRVLALLLALLTLAWLPVDYLLLPHELFLQFVLLRTLVAVVFLGLGLWERNAYQINFAYLRLGLLIFTPGAFYVSATFILHNANVDAALTGYNHFPFLLISLGAIFPLTLVEGCLAAFAVLILFISTKGSLGLMIFPQIINDLWLMGLLGGLALWTELTQVHILMRLHRQATRDPLTGLFNRRIVMEHLQEAVDKTRRRGQKLSVMLMDLDRFKRINDLHGHLAGDAVLETFAGFLKSEAFNPYLIGRYGGEEFLAVLPNTDKKTAHRLATQVRDACHDAVVTDLDGVEIRFTTSIGLAELRPDEDINSLLDRVDERLYSAKESGRDLVVI